MDYTEAFRKLGYDVAVPRQDWTAEKADGVCITLWKEQIRHPGGPLYLDLWELYPDGTAGEWVSLPGHKKRTRHLKRAVDEFGGRVDVILCSGTPGDRCKNPKPWLLSERREKHWHVTKLDPESGFFRAEIAM